MSALRAAIERGETWLSHGRQWCRTCLEAAGIISDLLAAAREAEADVARLTRAHGGCDAQVRTLVSQGLAAIRKAEAAEAALANDPARRFGLLCLAAWWNEGQPGDLEGDVLQDYADRVGLWHRVDRHADGVECEWCGNDGSGCGELTDAGERAWAEEENVPVRSAPSRINELTVLLRESNAVCLCGCPESEHESYGEDGESCGVEGHDCVRTSRSVAAMLATERRRREEAEAALRHAARELQHIADDDPCEKLHQTGEGLACIALAEELLGPMRDWPGEPNASGVMARRDAALKAAPAPAAAMEPVSPAYTLPEAALSRDAFEHLLLDYADAAYQTGKAWASAEDDALKAHLGSRLRAHDAALREALDAAKGGPDA